MCLAQQAGQPAERLIPRHDLLLLTGKRTEGYTMSAVPHTRWTVAKYLAFERASQDKHELIGGELYLMAGASRRHNLIVVNLAVALGNQLRGRACEAYVSDMRVRLVSGDYVYPDVVLVCGEPAMEDSHLDTLLNPQVIIEVLSPSTEQFDRGQKFARYRQMPSLRDYLLVAQDNMQIEHYERQPDGETWLYSEAKTADARIRLASVDCTLIAADVYERVFEGPAADA